MARLPIPGSDSGTWGTILNTYLSVSLNADGTINSTAANTQTNGLQLNSNLSTDGTLAANSVTLYPSQSAVKTYSMPFTYLDTSTTLAANSDTKVPSQKAVKTYVDNTVKTSTIYQNTGGVTISNTTTPSSLFSAAPTLTGTTGDVFRVRGTITYLNNSGGSRTVSFSLRVGTTTIHTTASISFASQAANRFFPFESLIRVNGDNNYVADAVVYYSGSNISTGGNTGTDAIQTGAGFDVVVTLGSTNATQSATISNALIEKIKA